jgi:hypothetical protein
VDKKKKKKKKKKKQQDLYPGIEKNPVLVNSLQKKHSTSF